MFLEQPQNTTINESETAIFGCAVVNLSFSILWRVNDSDASYTQFRIRGISVITDDDDYSRSQLHVIGHAYNNNTVLHCGALQNHMDPKLAWIESGRALLRVIKGQ